MDTFKALELTKEEKIEADIQLNKCRTKVDGELLIKMKELQARFIEEDKIKYNK